MVRLSQRLDRGCPSTWYMYIEMVVHICMDKYNNGVSMHVCKMGIGIVVHQPTGQPFYPVSSRQIHKDAPLPMPMKLCHVL